MGVFVTFGIEQQFRFSSHPGVMAITKLLEMSMITRMRANFTEDNIEQIKKFDPSSQERLRSHTITSFRSTLRSLKSLRKACRAFSTRRLSLRRPVLRS